MWDKCRHTDIFAILPNSFGPWDIRIIESKLPGTDNGELFYDMHFHSCIAALRHAILRHKYRLTTTKKLRTLKKVEKNGVEIPIIGV